MWARRRPPAGPSAWSRTATSSPSTPTPARSSWRSALPSSSIAAANGRRAGPTTSRAPSGSSPRASARPTSARSPIRAPRPRPTSTRTSEVKTIGVIGGMSAESTAIYYRELNRLVRERLGGLHSAELLIRSVDFAPIAELQAADRWDETGAGPADAARKLEAAGADVILLATNTMHLNAEAIRGAIGVPFLHIGDATAAALKAWGGRRPLLLATRFTMEKAFYKDRLGGAGRAPRGAPAGPPASTASSSAAPR